MKRKKSAQVTPRREPILFVRPDPDENLDEFRSALACKMAKFVVDTVDQLRAAEGKPPLKKDGAG